jgi:hypothetical protein
MVGDARRHSTTTWHSLEKLTIMKCGYTLIMRPTAATIRMLPMMRVIPTRRTHTTRQNYDDPWVAWDVSGGERERVLGK